MNKFKRLLFLGVAVMMLLLTGCGTQLYELTAEEEELIVHSAAYFVAKHNIQQKDGANGVPLPESFEEEESEAESEVETEDGESVSGSESDASSKPAENEVSLAEVIGHKDDLKVTYEGNYVANSYTEPGGSATADSGKTFYIMKFKLTNNTNRDIAVDNISKRLAIKLVSDAISVQSEETFLMREFSTYLGTIKAGESVETILLFEVSEGVAQQISAPTLQITVGNSTKNIKL